MPTKVALIALAVAATTLAGCQSDPSTVTARPPSVSFGKAKVDLLRTGGKRYLRPNKQFWIMSTTPQQGTLPAQAMGDRWVTGVDKDPSVADLFAG